MGESGFGPQDGDLYLHLAYWLLFPETPGGLPPSEEKARGSPGQRQMQPHQGRPAGAPAQSGKGPGALSCPDSWSSDQVKGTSSPFNTYPMGWGRSSEFQEEIGDRGHPALCPPACPHPSPGSLPPLNSEGLSGTLGRLLATGTGVGPCCLWGGGHPEARVEGLGAVGARWSCGPSWGALFARGVVAWPAACLLPWLLLASHSGLC